MQLLRVPPGPLQPALLPVCGHSAQKQTLLQVLLFYLHIFMMISLKNISYTVVITEIYQESPVV